MSRGSQLPAVPVNYAAMLTWHRYCCCWLQIQKQLVRVRDSCHVGVLSRNNIALLEEVLKVVGAAMPWNRQPSHSDGLSLCTLGHTFGVIKVQN